MTQLSSFQCAACQAGAPLASEQEISQFMRQLPDWQLIEVSGQQRLKRSFKFKNFRQALEFTNQVGQLAEAQGHHPQLITEWGQVKVSWWTHKIGGLHRNDFIMAAKTDQLFST